MTLSELIRDLTTQMLEEGDAEVFISVPYHIAETIGDQKFKLNSFAYTRGSGRRLELCHVKEPVSPRCQRR